MFKATERTANTDIDSKNFCTHYLAAQRALFDGCSCQDGFQHQQHYVQLLAQTPEKYCRLVSCSSSSSDRRCQTTPDFVLHLHLWLDR